MSEEMFLQQTVLVNIRISIDYCLGIETGRKLDDECVSCWRAKWYAGLRVFIVFLQLRRRELQNNGPLFNTQEY